MGGICGYVNKSGLGRSDSANHIKKLLDPLPGQNDTQIFQSVSEPAIMGTKAFPGYLSGVREKVSQGHLLKLAFFGTIYNQTQLFHPRVKNEEILDHLLGKLQEKGMAFLQHIQGDFVFSFWDGRQDSLFLVVDGSRTHPLYYSADKGQNELHFSSSLPGLLRSGALKDTSLNSRSILNMISLSVIFSPDTIFNQINKIPSGHFLSYQKGEIQLKAYWEPNFLFPHQSSEKTLQKETRQLFDEAISSRMRLDQSLGKVGAFLSGGVDSSTVVGTLSKFSEEPIDCFSIGFDVQGFNEMTFAKIAAKAFNANHYEYYVSSNDVHNSLMYLIENFDEPFGNASAIPTYFCAKLAKEHGVDILYAGDGGDELFAGNERYGTQKIFDYYYRIPKFIRGQLLEPFIFSLNSYTNIQPIGKISRYIRRAKIPYPDRLLSWGLADYVDRNSFWDQTFLEDVGNFTPLNHFESLYHQAKADTNLNRQLYIDLKTTISDNDLVKVVKMTKAANMAVRFPFLDKNLMEFAAKIPDTTKMKGLKLRSFFKKAYKDFLPNTVITKSKQGFGLPISHWLRNDKNLNELMLDTLLGNRFSQRKIITRRGIEQLIESHKSANTSLHGTIIWNLLILELWLEHNGQ